MSLNSANGHLRRATAIVNKIVRDFDRSVFELHRHLDAVREDLEETGKSLIGRGARPKHGDVRVQAAANDDAKPKASTAPEVGAPMPDGSVYAGVSPDSGAPMYATPADAPLSYTFNQAQKYASKLDAHGHHDWRVPTKGELNVLFQNRAAIGRFDESGSGPAGWYWSSSQSNYVNAWAQRFSDGSQDYYRKYGVSSLRCVR